MNSTTMHPSVWIALLFACACTPALSVPSATTPLDSALWSDCSQLAADRQSRSFLDDMKLTADALLCQGVAVAVAGGQMENGLEMLLEAAVRNQTDYRGYYLTARILSDARRYEEALSAYARARDRYAEVVVPSEDLIRSVQDHYGEAAALYFGRQAADRGLCDYGCAVFLAGLYVNANQMEEAESLLTALISQEPDKPHAYIRLAEMAHGKEDFATEAKRLDGAIATSEFATLPPAERATLFYQTAFAHYTTGNDSAARRVLERALAIADEAEWWLLSGQLSFRAGDPALAITRYEKALALDAQLVSAHVAKGDAELTLERPKDAVKQFEMAIAIDPEHAVARLKLANAHAILGNRAEAVAQLNEALQLRPENLPENLRQEVMRSLESFETTTKAPSAKP